MNGESLHNINLILNYEARQYTWVPLKEVVRLYDSGKFTLKELSIEFNCKNMSRIVRRTKGEIVK